MEMTIEQKRALAIAEARKRAAAAQMPREDRVRAEFAEKPWYAQAGQAVKDIARLGARGATFGFADRAAAAIRGTSPEEERQLSEDALTRAGGAGTVAEIGGSMILPGGAFKAGVSPTALAAGKGLGTRMLAGATEGAALGALDATGRDQEMAPSVALGAAGGALAQPIAGAVSAAVDRGGQMVKRLAGKAPKVPTGDELRAASQAAYDRSEQAGVMLAKPGLERMRQEIIGDLTDLGFLPANQPRTAAVLKEIDRVAQGHATLKGLDQVRKAAGNSFSLEKSDNKALEKIIKRIDRHVSNLADADVVMGDKVAGPAALKEARSLWSRMAKADTVEQAVNKGNLMASTNASGGNTENEVRKQIRQLVTNPKKTRGWTPDEFQAAVEAARGSPVQNFMRQVGRLSPQGNGVGTMFGLNALAQASPEMLAGSVAGGIAKPISTAMAKSKANRLAEMMRAGGTLEALEGAPNAAQRLAKREKDLLARALAAGALEPVRQD